MKNVTMLKVCVLVGGALFMAAFSVLDAQAYTWRRYDSQSDGMRYLDNTSSSRYDYHAPRSGRYVGNVVGGSAFSKQSYTDPDNYVIKRLKPKRRLPTGNYGRAYNVPLK